MIDIAAVLASAAEIDITAVLAATSYEQVIQQLRVRG